MREVRTKIIIGALLVTLVIPSVLFLRPQKAEAVASLTACVAAKIKAAISAGAKSITNAVTSVNTSDWVSAQEAAEAPAAADWQGCFLKGFAIIIGKALLHTFTQSVIKWINSGFEGSPSFVTNPEGFLNNVADQAIGEVIEGISPLLCAPFRINLRFSLGLNLSLNSKESIHCKLSDVLANVRGAYDGFVGGAIGSGNLSQWIHIAGTPQNNPYGAYIATTNKLSLGITSATGKEVKLLDWGQGFKSWKDCEKYGPDVVVKKNGATLLQSDEVTPITRKGPCIKEGPIKTPGSVIVGNTTGALNSTFRELELANEIDAVVGALINQMLKQVMGAGAGLLGAGKGGGSSGYSYADSLITDPAEALEASSAIAPEGIDCGLHYYPSTKEALVKGDTTKLLKSGVYVLNDAVNQVWTDNLPGKTIGVAAGDKRTIVEAKYLKGKVVTPLNKGVLLWTDYFKSVKLGCKNFNGRFVNSTSRKTLEDYYKELGENKPNPGAVSGSVAPAVEPGNIALRKKAIQSSISSYNTNESSPVRRASFAVDGQLDGNLSWGLALTDRGYPSVKQWQWWRVDLATNMDGQKPDWEINEISKINIYGGTAGSLNKYSVCSPASNSCGFRVIVTSEETDGKTLDQIIESSANVVNEVGSQQYPEEGNRQFSKTFSAGIKGRYVLIISTVSDNLGIAEVQVIGKQTRLQAEGGGSGTVAPPVFAFTVIPTSPTNVEIRSGETFLWPGISFLPNKVQDNITFRALFYTYDKDLITSVLTLKPEPESFTNHLNSLNFTYNLNNIGTSKDAINLTMDNKGSFYNSVATPTSPLTGTSIYTDSANPEKSGVTFAKNLNFTNMSLGLTLTASTRGNPPPFRIVIEAHDNLGKLVGSTSADFTPKQ